jgi:hypothetical protein
MDEKKESKARKIKKAKAVEFGEDELLRIARGVVSRMDDEEIKDMLVDHFVEIYREHPDDLCYDLNFLLEEVIARGKK